MARPLTVIMWAFLALSFASLANAFLTNDFSVRYVAQHSNTLLPKPYQFAAIWGGHEGSLLLWTFILTIWTVAVTLFSRHLPEEMVARVVGVKTVAEFVDRPEVLARLQAIGIDYAQGFLLHRPQPLASLVAAEPALRR